MTQKKILLKSMRALEFQCPLKFRCQTRDYNHFLTEIKHYHSEKIVLRCIPHVRKSATPIKFLVVDFLVIPELSKRYFRNNPE